MAHLYADRVREVFTGTGPGNITVEGAVAGGFTTFAAAIGVGNTTEVCALDPVTGEWEVFATQVLSATVLDRGTRLASSTGARISFASGTKEVFCCLPAAEAMRRTDIEAELDALAALVAAKIGDAPSNGTPYVRQDAVWVEMPRRPPFVDVTGATHAPGLGVDGRWFVCTNAGGCVATMPTNAAVAFPIGTILTYEQDAAGTLTFPEVGGVVIKKPTGRLRETAEQGAVVQIAKRATDTWVLYGNLKAA